MARDLEYLMTGGGWTEPGGDIALAIGGRRAIDFDRPGVGDMNGGRVICFNDWASYDFCELMDPKREQSPFLGPKHAAYSGIEQKKTAGTAP
jgi:hypothetical protein